MKKGLLWFVLLGVSMSFAFGQSKYQGGSGQGYGSVGYNGGLAATTLSNTKYAGRSGQGYVAANLNTGLQTADLNATKFAGGSGQGYASINYNGGMTEGAFSLYKFYGGSGQGYSGTGINSGLNQSSLSSIKFQGGSGQGYVSLAKSTGSLLDYVTPLPVTFLYFKAVREQDADVLSWATATEINNKGFEIESSEDGITFANIGYEKGMGNSNKTCTYSFSAKYHGNVFYRLKQIDFNGHFEYSPVLFLRSALKNEMSIYPNPASSTFNIQIPQPTEIYITNTLGQVVFRESVNKQATIYTDTWAEGLYIVTGFGFPAKKLVVRR